LNVAENWHGNEQSNESKSRQVSYLNSPGPSTRRRDERENGSYIRKNQKTPVKLEIGKVDDYSQESGKLQKNKQ